MFKFNKRGKPHIFLIGTGGTGGFFLEYITRLFAGQEITIDIYDGDTVEAKNLKRQNFTVEDLDLKKTRALINKLEKQVLNPPTFVEHATYIATTDDFLGDILAGLNDNEYPVIVSAVDNIETRRLINQTISDLKDIDIDVIAIDSGNSDQGGQIVLYSNSPVMFNEHGIGPEKEITLMNMLEMFPEIDVIKSDHDKNPAHTQNCADNAESKPQSMMANVRNAEVMANIMIQLIENKPFVANLWVSDCLTGNTRGELHV